MAAPQKFNIMALPGQIAKLDQRIQRIELALDQILQRLGMPELGQLAPAKEPAPVAEIVKTGSYVYKPLDATKDEIRLLVLYGSNKDNEPVKAQLRHFSLEEDKRPGSVASMPHLLRMFKALSYTWGHNSETINITLDGYQFPVTENLFAALKNVRNVNKAANTATPASGKVGASYWWIDAICINQGDVLERNQQVAMMTRIYKRSFGVHIWLGGEGEGSDMAMDLVEKVASFKTMRPGEKEVIYPDLSIEEKVMNWKALTQLFQRPWWERVWVRQEVAVPKFASVQCGTKTCSFDHICTVASVLHSLNEQLGYQPVQFEGYSVDQYASTSGPLRISCYLRAKMLQELRASLGLGIMAKYGELTDMLFHIRSCKSTDPRDKVFSVLGLVDPTVYDIKPDYRLTIDQVLKAVTRSIITNKQSLDILAGSQNSEGENGLPSWVPNLTEEWRARPLKTKITYSSDMPDEPNFTFEPDNESVLRVNGRIIASISAISDNQVTGDATTEQLDILYQNWKTFVLRIKDHLKLDWDGLRDFRDFAEGEENDRKWIEFLSLATENGNLLRFSEDGKLLPEKGAAAEKAYRNPKMVNSLLLPKSDDEEAIKVHPYGKYHENLRKYGIGRRLAYLSNGCVGLVPGNTREEDELCIFNNTCFPFILRKVQDGNRVNIGEAYFPRYKPYDVPYEDGKEVKITHFSII